MSSSEVEREVDKLFSSDEEDFKAPMSRKKSTSKGLFYFCFCFCFAFAFALLLLLLCFAFAFAFNNNNTGHELSYRYNRNHCL